MIPQLLTAATIGASLYNSISSHESQRDLRAMQLQLYERQRKDTFDLMDRQNAYNSPASQMQRLREAGLNPHLIYSGGATTPSVSASPAPPPQLQPVNKYFDPQSFQAASQVYLQLQSLELQNKNLDLQNRGLEADVKLKERQGNLLDAQAVTEASKKVNTDANTQYVLSQTDLAQQAHDFKQKMQPLEYLASNLDYKYKKIFYPLQEINSVLQNEKLRTEIFTSQFLAKVQGDLSDAQIKKLHSDKDLNVQQKNFLDLVQDFRVEQERMKMIFDKTNQEWRMTLPYVLFTTSGEMLNSFIPKLFGK